MATFADYQKRRQRRTVTVAIPTDPSVVSDLEEARRQLAAAERRDRISNGDKEAPAIRQAIDELVERAQADVLTFKFGELPRSQWRTMKELHVTPDDDDRAYDPETLGPELLAAAAVDPELTPTEAATIWNDWGDWAVGELFLAALDAQSKEARVPFGAPSSDETDDSQTN